MEQFQSPDLPLLKRFTALLEQQTEELILRQIAQRLELPDGPDGKVNPTLRSMAGKSALIRQWAIKRPGKTTTYWMPYNRRSTATQQGIPGSAGFLDNQLTPQLSEGVSRVNHGSTVGELPAKALPEANQNTEKSADIHTPSLNGQTDTFWQIVRDNPNDLPVQIANKLQAATGRNLIGAQVKALIAAGSPAIETNDE